MIHTMPMHTSTPSEDSLYQRVVRWLDRYPCTVMYLFAMLCAVAISTASVIIAVLFSFASVAAIGWYRHTHLRR